MFSRGRVPLGMSLYCAPFVVGVPLENMSIRGRLPVVPIIGNLGCLKGEVLRVRRFNDASGLL